MQQIIIPRRVPKEPAWQAVEKLAATKYEKVDLKMFDFRRLLIAYFASPKHARPEVERFCRLTDEDFMGVWTEVNAGWETAQFPIDGNDGFEWAVARVDNVDIDFPPHLVPQEPQHIYRRVLRLCWLLHAFNGNGQRPFILPQKKIAEWLGFGGLNKPVSLVIKWLKENEILVCVDETYRFGAGKGNKGKKYRLSETFISFIENTKTAKPAKSTKCTVSVSEQERQGVCEPEPPTTAVAV